MTPLGAKLRTMREERGVTLKDMARALRVSSAYLSALEHGRRGKPTWILMQRIIAYFNVIWDEAEELQRLAEFSDPRITIDTGGLEPEATELANRLAAEISRLQPEDLVFLRNEVVRRASRNGRPTGQGPSPTARSG
jgi:transcriptional regulator with XRE-family HTH domain